MKDFLKCNICGKQFDKIKGKHLHISKSHEKSLSDYYEEFHPKKSKLFKEKIRFKNYNQYLSQDFINREELIKWCYSENKDAASKYIKNLLKNRIESKSVKHSLSEIELELCEFPDIESYKYIFGSYSSLCKELGLSNSLNKKIPSDFFDFEENPHLNPEKMKIFVDTREQKPINFMNSELMKLDFGDYTAAGSYYDYTYIDRKSEGDLKSTLSGQNYERFRRELDRAREFNSYVFVLVESSIQKIIENNELSPHRSKLPYIWHNLKTISQEYKDCCQFVFAGNRNGLKKLIPKILLYGKSLWNVDLQYFLNIKINEKRKNNLVT